MGRSDGVRDRAGLCGHFGSHGAEFLREALRDSVDLGSKLVYSSVEPIELEPEKTKTDNHYGSDEPDRAGEDSEA